MNDAHDAILRARSGRLIRFDGQSQRIAGRAKVNGPRNDRREHTLQFRLESCGERRGELPELHELNVLGLVRRARPNVRTEIEEHFVAIGSRCDEYLHRKIDSSCGRASAVTVDVRLIFHW